MQNLKHYVRIAEKFTTSNSPAILTVIGVAGTISTAVLSAKAHVVATDRLRDARYERDREALTNPEAYPLTRKDEAKLVWKLYVPPISVAAITCTAIVSANRIGTRRTAALAAAYAGSEKAFDEYKDKVSEMFGDGKEQKVRDEVAQDQVRKNPPGTELLIDGEERTLFYDPKCGRYFLSTMEDVKAAQNHCNYILNKEGDVSLNTFYSWLGLNTTTDGEELGWRFDKGEVELMFSSTIADNNKPAIVMTFRTVPIRHSSH